MALRRLELLRDYDRAGQLFRAGSVVAPETIGGPFVARQLVATGGAEWREGGSTLADALAEETADFPPAMTMDRKARPGRERRR